MTNKSLVYLIDVGIGNIGSVARMISKTGVNVSIVKDASQISKEGKVILPGVGKFDSAITLLANYGFEKKFWIQLKNRNTPILGICLGMQLLCRRSEEGSKSGLGLIEAEVKKFQFTNDQQFKVPHMGWNTVNAVKPNPIIPTDSVEQRFYFVHSYKVVPDDQKIIIGLSNYGGEFCAAFQEDNIFGVQFHPEKSHRFGLELIKRFIEL